MRLRELNLRGCARRVARTAVVLLPGLILLAAAPAFGQSGDWVVPERRAARANPLQATPEVVAEGKKLFARECASCHGATGDNDGAKAPKEITNARKLSDPALWEQTDGALFWKIAEGRKPMPGTLDVLSDRERWQVVLYVRTLAPKAGAATALQDGR